MTKTNKEIMEAVIEDMPKDDAKALEKVKSGADFLKVAEDYPSVQNSFINTLTNKVTKSLIFSKIFNNPLKELKKGKLEYGDSIEELFVQMAMAKNFGEHWGNGSDTPEADLIRKLTPKVTAMYISVNFDKKYKTTVMNKQLRKAFLNEGGLSRLIMQIVGSITSQAEYTEFVTTKNTLKALVEEGKQLTLDAEHKNSSTSPIPLGKIIKQTPYVVETKNTLDFVTQLRTSVGDMKFPSTKYNLAKELNWSNPEDLILVTTPKTIAELDTNVLASAFNVSKANLTTRVILVDEMPAGVFKKQSGTTTPHVPADLISSDQVEKDATHQVQAILMDKDLLQIWDTYQGAGNFFNPEGEYTNHFANRECIFALCTFANMIVFTKSEA